jgi:hypothetical protein
MQRWNSPLRAFAFVLVAAAAGIMLAGADSVPAKAPVWKMNASIIEACSCPMFCQCYFSDKPASHHGMGHAEGHYCKFNNAFKVNSGTYGDTNLAGAMFWVAGDLGGDFSKGQMDWAVLTFDPSVTPAQRTAITAILGNLYPVKWNSFTVAPDSKMEWNASKDRSVAKLDGGKTAEVALVRFPGMTDDPIVIKNLRYWGAPRNEGFVLMPNEVESYRAGSKPFEFKGTNGFMITFDISSADVKM